MSRETEFTQEMADIICARLAAGESMRSISRDETMPCMTTLFKWLRTNELFAQQYAKAKEESADALLEEMFDIADNASNDWMEQHDKENVGWRTNGEHIQRARLRVDVRKWAASKLKPKKYGDKVELDGNINVTVDPIKLLLEQIEGSSIKPKDESNG